MSVMKESKKNIKVNNECTSIIVEAEKSLVKKNEYENLYRVFNIKDLNTKLRNMYSTACIKSKKGYIKSRNWVTDSAYRTKFLKKAIISILIAANVIFMLSSLSLRYEVYMNSQYLGIIDSKKEMLVILDKASKELFAKKKIDVCFSEAPSFKPILALKSQKIEKNEIIKNIELKGLYTIKEKTADKALEQLTKDRQQPKSYKVQKGDTLWVIARNNGLTIDSIIKLNPGLTENIKEGQEILLDTSAAPTMNIKTKKIPKAQIEKVGTKNQPPKLVTGTFTRPVLGMVTSRFGQRWGRKHEGIDLEGNIGDPIFAADGGRVAFVGIESGYGKLIKIKHDNGYETYYGHCSKILVKAGNRVSKKQMIGKIGMTGKTTGPHLHFEIRKNGNPINPTKYLK